MFFELVELVKCNRTALGGNTSIRICPTTKTQQVLGTNSSGKSSLIELGFCPLAPEPHNFDAGGSWHVIVHHKGHIYDLRADYGDKNFYSFIVDGGDNLNRGKTITVQNALVKEHLNYDHALHAFLTGRKRFTTMGANERRDWIARMSANDFTYAFQKHAGFKKSLNAATTVSKYLQKQLADAQSSLMDPDDVLQMRQKANELHETLELLMREPKRSSNAWDDATAAIRVDRLISQIDQHLKQEYPFVGKVGSTEELDALYKSVTEEIQTVKGELRVREERLEECEQRKVRAQMLMKLPPEELKSNIDDIEGQLIAIPPYVTDLQESLLIPAPKAIADLRLVIATLPADKKTFEDVNVLREKHYVFQAKEGKISGLLTDIDRQIHDIKNCQAVACPNCHTEFKPGVPEGKLEELQERHSRGSVMAQSTKVEVQEVVEELQATAEIAEAYRELDTIRAKHQSTNPGLFIYLDQFGWSDLGRRLLEKIALYERDAGYRERKVELEARLDTQRIAYETYQKEASSISGAFDDYTQATEAYNDVYKKFRVLGNRQNRLADIGKGMDGWLTVTNRLFADYEALKLELINYANYQGDLMVDELITKTKVTLGIHEAALHENETYETLVKDLTKQLNVSRVQEEAYKRLVDVLCPKTGLIAEQITLQISSILDGVNGVIGRVWGYPLSVTPGELEDNEVDYKFPLIVDTVPRPDIAAGSTSVKDVVDQAFRLAGYYCMDLTDYPLYLDEFGSSFDEAHRHNMIPVLKDLIDDPRFSQVLLISHSLDGQTAFSGTETIILDDRNIKFPFPYNQHVTFS